MSLAHVMWSSTAGSSLPQNGESRKSKFTQLGTQGQCHSPTREAWGDSASATSNLSVLKNGRRKRVEFSSPEGGSAKNCARSEGRNATQLLW